MTISGKAIFFDGITSARHEVEVGLAPAALMVRSAAGDLLTEWPYDEIEALSAPDGLLRIGRLGSPALARLDVRDPALAAAIDERSLPIDRSGLRGRRSRRKVAAWSIAATVSLLLVGIYGVPAVATRLTPFVPYAVERRLGTAVDAQVRDMLGAKTAGDHFVCGTDEPEHAGRMVFDKLFARLQEAAAPPTALRIAVVRNPDSNAITLPGGIIYVFRGLIDSADNADEVAGVIAHELGHVAHRDGTRLLLQYGGMTFLFGMLLGDFVGGGAVVLVAKTILQTSYSREAEAAADAYAVGLMNAIRADGHALGTILTRIAGSSHSPLKILLGHPETKERVAAIGALAKPGPYEPLLDVTEFGMLKTICSAERGK